MVTSEKQSCCPVLLVLEIIEGKWTAHIIAELFRGTRRHSELSKRLGSINPKTLTDRLRDLEHSGIVQRKMFEEIPPRVEYSLTAKGKELSAVFDLLKKLGTSWMKNSRSDRSTISLCLHCSDALSEQSNGAGEVLKPRGKTAKRPARGARR